MGHCQRKISAVVELGVVQGGGIRILSVFFFFLFVGRGIVLLISIVTNVKVSFIFLCLIIRLVNYLNCELEISLMFLSSISVRILQRMQMYVTLRELR